MRGKILWSLACVLSASLMADYVVEYKLEEGSQTITYKDAQHHKFTTHSEGTQSHIYRIGEKIYMVSVEDGQTQVVDMDEMRSLIGAFGASASQGQVKEDKFRIKKTGKKETIAGVKGEVWIVEGEMDAEPYRDEVVMTQDKRVVATFDAMMGTIMKMGEGVEGLDQDFQFEKGWAPIKAQQMELKSVAERSVDAGEYELPKNAQVQKMPDFAGILGGKGEAKQGGGGLSNCYTQVCCGQSAGPSKALKKMLKERSGGFEFAGDGVCDIMGLGTALGIQSVEGALYTKGEDAIQVTLNMDDASSGSVRNSQQAIKTQGHAGLIQEVKNYKTGTIGGKEYYYGLLMPPKQQTLDIIIDAKTTLSVTHLSGSGEIDLISWSKGAINLGAYSAPAKTQTKSTSKGAKEENSPEKEGINQGVDEAVQVFKSLF